MSLYSAKQKMSERLLKINFIGLWTSNKSLVKNNVPDLVNVSKKWMFNCKRGKKVGKIIRIDRERKRKNIEALKLLFISV